jgi:hypothetical protein
MLIPAIFSKIAGRSVWIIAVHTTKKAEDVLDFLDTY